MSAEATEKELRRWAEALAGIARTGMAFTDNEFERERYEEILAVAGDIKAAADEGREGALDAEGHVVERIHECGIAIGLAWTPVGGDILFIEATRMPGSGRLTLPVRWGM